jgi:hypothetical protein
MKKIVMCLVLIVSVLMLRSDSSPEPAEEQPKEGRFASTTD